MKSTFTFQRTALISALMLVGFIGSHGRSYAQEGFSWGPKAGLNVSSFITKENRGADRVPIDITYRNPKARAGFAVGAFGEYRTHKIGLAVELLYSMQGVNMQEAIDISWPLTFVEDAKHMMHYVNMPILFTAYVRGDLGFRIGLQPGFLMKATHKYTKRGTTGVNERHSENKTSIYNRFDLGIPIAVSLRIVDQLTLEARYTIGLINIEKETGMGSFKSRLNSVLTFSFAYRFQIKEKF